MAQSRVGLPPVEKMESKTSHPDSGISREMNGLDQMISYLGSGKTRALDLDRLDTFIQSQNLQNGIAPELKGKLFEILLRLRLEQIASTEYPIDFRMEKVTELETLIKRPGKTPQSFFEKMDEMNDSDFRIRIRDEGLRDSLFGLSLLLDGVTVSNRPALRQPKRQSQNGRKPAFDERQYNRRVESGEWRIGAGQGKQAKAASVPYPLQIKK